MRLTLVCTLFLILKAFQWLNGFMFSRILSEDSNYKIMMGALAFVVGLFIFSALTKKYLSPPALKNSWIIIVATIGVIMLMSPLWGIVALMSIFLYAMIATESHILGSLNNVSGVPSLLLAVLAFLPVVISYQFPTTSALLPHIFYVTSSIFAALAYYTSRYYGNKFVNNNPPSLLIGLIFTAVPILIYYSGVFAEEGGVPTMLQPFLLLFYSGGILAIYLTVDGYIDKFSGTRD